MADNTTPSRSANMEKAEGDRDTANENLRGSGASSDRDMTDEDRASGERLQHRPERGQVPEDPDRGAEDDWPAGRSER